jgi:lactam utilization protein B
LTILAKKKSLSLEFLEAKSQREKKMYLKGALDSAYFHRMRKETIYQIDAAGKLCRYQTRTLSYIKAKRVMYQELRHQVKIHKISEKLNT